MIWYALEINPEPWAIGPVGSARRGGKLTSYVGRNAQLHAYEEAIKEAVREQLPVGYKMIDGPIVLTLFFWRNRAEYTTPQAKTHRKHEADLTNLQKATEDALQGVLFKNDKDVCIVDSTMVEQGAGVVGRVVIGVEPFFKTMNERLDMIPSETLAAVDKMGEAPSKYTQASFPYGGDTEDIF